MPRLPNRVQGSPFGSVNYNSPNANLPIKPVSILQPGPAQAVEQFNHPSIPKEVARALNQLQTNIQQATSQVKADPTSNKNLFEQINLIYGGSGGTFPNVISHGLDAPYRGYRVCTVRNGAINQHAAITPTTAYPADKYLLLWTEVTTVFGTATVSADIEIWA
jgi:hypothetical protein